MTLSEFLQLFKKKPVIALALVILIMLCLQAKAYVDSKHEVAMDKISMITESQIRMENKMDKVILKLINNKDDTKSAR